MQTNETPGSAIRRMVAAGVVPITWLAVASEWQRDWARTDTLEALTRAITGHGGGSAIALAWEAQLLGSSTRRG
jgi:nicotinamidase-related amidase